METSAGMRGAALNAINLWEIGTHSQNDPMASNAAVLNDSCQMQKKLIRTAHHEKSWILYILRCGDGSFYAGITNDLARRLIQHRNGSASRYTRSRRPVMIVYSESCASRSDALRKEIVVKALSRKEKETLISPRKKIEPRRL